MRRIWSWLRELRFFWFALLFALIMVVTTIILPILLGQTLTIEQRIRIAGLLLQLFGIIVVSYNMQDFLRQWWKRYPGFREKVIESVTTDSINITDSCRISAIRQIDSTATIESRINNLERNHYLMCQRVEDIERDMDQKLQKCWEALEKERQTHDRNYQDLRFEWEEKEKRDLRNSFMGVVCLFVGVILSTISIELARFFS